MKKISVTLCLIGLTFLGSFAQKNESREINQDSIQFDKFGKLLYTVVTQYVDKVDSEVLVEDAIVGML